MEEATNIRWKQRFENFQKAIRQLKSAIDENGVSPFDIIKEGNLQRFEFSHELAWKVIKDYLEYEGIQQVNGSSSGTREAFTMGIIRKGQIWMDMIVSRNKTVSCNQNVLEVAIRPETLASVEEAIDELNTPYLFDISMFHELKSPSLDDHMKRVGKVFYKRKAVTLPGGPVF